MINTSSSNPSEEKQAQKERLEASLTSEQKELLQQAAEIEGTTLADFVIRSAQAEARRIIERYTRIKLNREDSRLFVESLLNPPEPNERMMALAAEYKQAKVSK